MGNSAIPVGDCKVGVPETVEGSAGVSPRKLLRMFSRGESAQESGPVLIVSRGFGCIGVGCLMLGLQVGLSSVQSAGQYELGVISGWRQMQRTSSLRVVSLSQLPPEKMLSSQLRGCGLYSPRRETS